jgi:hypothetical protein
MSDYDELYLIITTQDRLEFFKFRQRYIKANGYDKFKSLLISVQSEIDNEHTETI